MVKKSLALVRSQDFQLDFFKKWILFDLPLSIKPDNIYPMIVAGIKEYSINKNDSTS
jgi:hypothetical protein